MTSKETSSVALLLGPPAVFVRSGIFAFHLSTSNTRFRCMKNGIIGNSPHPDRWTSEFTEMRLRRQFHVTHSEIGQRLSFHQELGLSSEIIWLTIRHFPFSFDRTQVECVFL
jgi:hypothetical protein